MAKKTLKQQIADATQELENVEQQIKDLQNRKRQIKQLLQQLNEEQVAELGRQLLAKMKLTDEDVDAAFAVLEKMPIKNNGGHSYEN